MTAMSSNHLLTVISIVMLAFSAWAVFLSLRAKNFIVALATSVFFGGLASTLFIQLVLYLLGAKCSDLFFKTANIDHRGILCKNAAFVAKATYTLDFLFSVLTATSLYFLVRELMKEGKPHAHLKQGSILVSATGLAFFSTCLVEQFLL